MQRHQPLSCLELRAGCVTACPVVRQGGELKLTSYPITPLFS
jgi:hypothetical protein